MLAVRRGVYVDMRARGPTPTRWSSTACGTAALGSGPDGAGGPEPPERCAGARPASCSTPDHTLLHVTRANRAGTRLEAGVDHHVAELPDHDVVDARGRRHRVTSVARTAVDVARDTDRFECAVAAFDSALRRGVTREELAAALDAARSWPGARLASGALPLADGRADNPGESWSRVVLIALGLSTGRPAGMSRG